MLGHRKARLRKAPRRNKKTSKHKSSDGECWWQQKIAGTTYTERSPYYQKLFKLSIFNESRENLGCVHGVEPDCWKLGQLRSRDYINTSWFRTLKGWMWAISVFDTRGKFVVKKHGFVIFKFKGIVAVPKNEKNKWLNIRGIQTFTLVVKKLRYLTHVPKDVIKMIAEYIFFSNIRNVVYTFYFDNCDRDFLI